MNGSYQFECLEGRQTEADFLAERAQLRLDGFPDLLSRHGIKSSGRALEIGCGQGIRTRLIAEKFPDLEVVGIDRSAELLAMANRAARPSNLTFQVADLYILPFSDGTFDSVYARLVFMHSTNPTVALTEIKRVLKPGGRVLIEDADRDCMFFEPAPADFAEFWRKVQDGQRRLGGDPNVGRKLAYYLKVAGFEALETEVQPILGGGAEIDYLVRTLLPSLNTYLDPSDRAQGKVAISNLGALAKNPLASFYHFWFVTSGQRPGSNLQSFHW